MYNNNLIKLKNNIMEKINKINQNYIQIVNNYDCSKNNNYKMIYLFRGEIAKVSSIDYDLLSKYKWHNKQGYAAGSIKNKRIIMHRFILNAKENELVDHINGNKLDNRRENLRISNLQKNGENKKKKEGTSSIYVGVSFVNNKKKYSSYIQHNNSMKHLGHYDNDIDAAIQRDRYIVHHKLDHIQLNFPEKKK